MKRYILFAGSVYYPVGGMHDLRGEYETLEEARDAEAEHHKKHPYFEWSHIYDCKEGNILD